MLKIDWPRLFAEVRPTFLPYASFQVQTHLSPEQCREKIASVTQPQKMPALLPKRTSDDARLVFKGQVSANSFFIVPVERHGMTKYQGPQPFWLIGRIKRTFDGSDIGVKVFLDPFGFITACALFGVVSLQTFQVWSSTGLYFDLGKPFFVPLFLLRCLLVYLVVALPASFKAFQLKRMLERLLEDC